MLGLQRKMKKRKSVANKVFALFLPFIRGSVGKGAAFCPLSSGGRK